MFRHLANVSKVGKHRGQEEAAAETTAKAPLIPALRRVKEMGQLVLHTC